MDQVIRGKASNQVCLTIQPMLMNTAVQCRNQNTAREQMQAYVSAYYIKEGLTLNICYSTVENCFETLFSSYVYVMILFLSIYIYTYTYIQIKPVYT